MGLCRVEDPWTKCLPLRQVCEKYLANAKDVFRVSIDLEKGI